MRYCAVCGAVVHDACLRHVGDTCRPLSVQSDHPQHFWVVSGTALGMNMDGDGNEGFDSGMSVQRDTCSYCGHHAGGMASLHAKGPVWQCAHCMATVHVACFCASHPDLSEMKDYLPAAVFAREHLTIDGKLEPRQKHRRFPSSVSTGSLSSERLERLDVCSMGPLQ